MSILTHKKIGVYEIRNTINGHRYIGSSVNIPHRWIVHKISLRCGIHHSRYLQRAWKKYGENAFQFNILAECTKEECIVLEQRYLDSEKPEYNVSKNAGSPLGIKRSEEVKQRLRELHKNDIPSKYTLQRAIEANTGKHRSEETKEKLRKMFTGRKVSDEQKQKLSAAHKGKKRGPRTEEVKAKISASKMGHFVSEESRKKMSLAKLKWNAEHPYKKKDE